jgi:hypothetical protein
VKKKYKYEDWMAMLSDEKTDWGANLILYWIYAIECKNYAFWIQSRETWVMDQRKIDIEYWKRTLPH